MDKAIVQIYFKDLPDPVIATYKNMHVKRPDNITTATFNMTPLSKEVKQIKMYAPYADPINKTITLVTEAVYIYEMNYFNKLIQEYTNNTDLVQSKSNQFKSDKVSTEKIIRLVLFHESMLDQIYNIWQKAGGFLTFIYAPLLVGLPIIIKAIRKYLATT